MDRPIPQKKIFVPEDKHEANMGDPRYHEDLFRLTDFNDLDRMAPSNTEPPQVSSGDDNAVDFPF